MKKSVYLLISMMFVVALLAGCGKEEDIITQIQERGYITIATSGNNRPTIYPNEKNELVGLDADWAQIVADHLGVDIEWKVMDFKGTIPAVTAGQVDIAMSGISVTEERAKTVDFSDSYAFEDVIAVYPEDVTDIESAEDIEGKIVGVVAGSSNGEAPVLEIGGYEKMVQYPSLANVFADLKNGRTDLAVTGRIVAGDWLVREGEGYKMTKKGYLGSKIAIVVDKKNPELTATINEAIKKAKEEGKYEELAIKHIGSEFAQ